MSLLEQHSAFKKRLANQPVYKKPKIQPSKPVENAKPLSAEAAKDLAEFRKATKKSVLPASFYFKFIFHRWKY